MPKEWIICQTCNKLLFGALPRGLLKLRSWFWTPNIYLSQCSTHGRTRAAPTQRSQAWRRLPKGAIVPPQLLAIGTRVQTILFWRRVHRAREDGWGLPIRNDLVHITDATETKDFCKEKLALIRCSVSTLYSWYTKRATWWPLISLLSCVKIVVWRPQGSKAWVIW